jgi:ribonuclease HI
MTPDAELDAVVALELELLEPATRAASERLEPLLHPEFREIGASGRRWDRAGVIDALTADPGEPWSAHEIVARRVVRDVVLVTYTARRAAGASLRSSLWVRENDRWQVVFHQGTPAPPG